LARHASFRSISARRILAPRRTQSVMADETRESQPMAGGAQSHLGRMGREVGGIAMPAALRAPLDLPAAVAGDAPLG
jgi:hypothetical protein